MFTAHISEDGKRIQTVRAHCDSAAELASEYGHLCGLEKSGSLAALLHDMGKSNVRFDDYIHGRTNVKKGEIDHSFAGAKYISEHLTLPDVRGCSQAAEMIAHTIISHHGIHDWCNLEHYDYFKERISKDDDYKASCEAVEEELSVSKLKSLMEGAADEYMRIYEICCQAAAGLSSNEKRCAMGFYLGMTERLLQSILIDADRTNTASFMSDTDIEREYDTKALWKVMSEKMMDKLRQFGEPADSICLQRKSISERCAAAAENKVGITRLIVPTGGGKTLASLRFAIEYCRQHEQHDMKKIIYIAPFMSILEQNSDEIRSIAGDENFLEHYSDAVHKHFEKNNDNEYHEYELRTELWDSPVIATTLVQLLDTLFSDKLSAVRRMHRLSRAVIIIDEVQSVPLSCIYPFNLAINYLSRVCGSSIVLCSATQPAFDRMRKYPVLLDENSSLTGDYSEDFKVFSRTEIIPDVSGHGYSYSEAAKLALKRFDENGSLLFITNTKVSARNIYTELKALVRDMDDPPRIIHLSTNMCPQHRREHIGVMRDMLKEKQPVICVTTQLIEAGVDVSFGCVIRSLAGMDNAAQAAGRCNRHGEFNRLCPVYIVKLSEEGLGSLKEIREAQYASQAVLKSMERDDAKDYISPESLEYYYRKLFGDAEDARSNALCYPMKNTHMVDLISVNNRLTSAHSIEKNRIFSMQAFKTAGENFHVIGDNTRDVIVCYNDEARELINSLNSDIPPSEALRCIRKAQKYIVGLYPIMWKRLCDEGAVAELKNGSFSLKEEYYSNEYGVSDSGGTMEFIDF